MKLKFKILDPECMPYKKYPTDAGYDLRAREATQVIPGGMVKIGAGVAVEIPPGHVGDIRPRSSISAKGLVLPIGTVDPGYTGEVGIILINAGNKAEYITKGERIAQLVVLPCLSEDIEVVNELPESDRGKQGFGSTGRS